MVQRGVSVSDACAELKLPRATWYLWFRQNRYGAADKYAVALRGELDRKAEEVIEIIDQFRAERAEALSQYRKARAEWEATPKEDRGDPPKYVGPDDLDLRGAIAASDVRKWKVARLHPDYADKSVIENHSSNAITQEIKITMSPQEAMSAYLKMINAKPV